MTIAIDTVCTEEQLDEYLGGQLAAQTALVPKGWDDAAPARQFALDETLDSLKRRRPPIREADITDATELRRAVLYGASARLYDLAISNGGDAEMWVVKHRAARKLFEAEVAGLDITGPAGANIGGGGSIKISRG